MDVFTVGLGVLALLYGIGTGFLRMFKPSAFSKLEPMKERYGALVGNLLHFVSYVVAPVIFGLVFLIAGLQGISMFELVGGGG